MLIRAVHVWLLLSTMLIVSCGSDDDDNLLIGSGTKVYFSEYVDGTGNDIALEVYNSTSGDIDLALCVVNIYANGSATVSWSYTLSGTLASNSVTTACYSTFSQPALCDFQSPNIAFNGDDAVELACDGQVMDIVGQIGVDPGSAWESGGVSTFSSTLRRNCDVSSGDADGSDAFDPSAEWTSAGLDDFTDLGSYVCP